MAGQSEDHTDLATTRAASIVEYLDAEGVDHTLIEHDPTMSAAEEARATGEPAHKVAKTIVLEDRGYVLAVVPGDERLDLHKLRELLGATKSLRLATEAEMADLFPSFEVGAVPPFGPGFPKLEVVDRKLLDEDRVLCAAGDHRHSVVLDPREIVRITGAVTADVCEDLERRSMTSLSKATVAMQMHHGVIACEPDASLRTMARAMESHGVHCVLVAGLASAGGGERFVWAVVTDADLVAAAVSDGDEKRAADVAQTEAPTIEPSATLADAAHTMAEHRVTHLIVLEPESEQPVGVVSSTDVVRALALERPS